MEETSARTKASGAALQPSGGQCLRLRFHRDQKPAGPQENLGLHRNHLVMMTQIPLLFPNTFNAWQDARKAGGRVSTDPAHLSHRAARISGHLTFINVCMFKERRSFRKGQDFSSGQTATLGITLPPREPLLLDLPYAAAAGKLECEF